MTELSQSTQKLIQRYQSWYKEVNREKTNTIRVDEVASAVAAFYEKIRGVVDWREEHLMKRAAVERILKRRLLIKGDDVAEPLVLELIRGGHFPNKSIQEVKIEEVRKIIQKYIFILDNSPTPPKEKQKVYLYDWLLGIAACEIEETLSISIREKALIEYMAEVIKDKIEGPESLTETEKNTQVYIAVQKALLKLDPSVISYNILKKRSGGQIDAKEIYSEWKRIENDLKHPLKDKFYRICEKYDTPYLLIGDILNEDPIGAPQKMKDPEILEKQITSAYEKRLKTIKSRIKRAAIYATLSIFLTKMILAFIIEIPFDVVSGDFNQTTLALNVLIPSLLMFSLILTIRPPQKNNLQRVIIETVKIAYATEKKDNYPLRITRKRGWIMNIIVTFFYLLTYVTSFGLIIFGLKQINFSELSIVIFLIFTSLISFAGVKLRERSKELDMIREKESFWELIFGLFSLPIIRMGRWLSSQWVRYNIIVVLVNFLIDMPFQRFVEFLEHWRAFLKEKREEIH